MIPYEELVSALARWRARRGLPTGLGDYLGEAPPPAFEMQSAAPDHSRDDVVELGDEMLDGVVEESHLHHAGYGPAQGRATDAGDGSFDGDMMDFGAHEESTKPAGLAGLAASAMDAGVAPGVDAELEGEAELPAEPELPAETKPARGRSRGGGRRRRK